MFYSTCISMTTRQIIKRFFEPVKESNELWWVLIRSIIYPFCYWFITIIWIKIIQWIIEVWTDWNSTLIIQYWVYFIWLTVFWLIIKILSKNRWPCEIRPKWNIMLMKYYLKKYTLLDNNVIESLWTWRVQHIIQTAIYSWIAIVSDISNKVPRYIAELIFWLALIFSINRIYWVTFLILACLIITIYIITQKTANKTRNVRKIVQVEIARDIVRIIMSKFEILQSNNPHEFDKYDKWQEIWLKCNEKVETYRVISDTHTTIWINGLKIFSIFLLIINFGFWIITIAEFVVLIFILNLLNFMSFDIWRLYIESADKRINIEKLRDLFDKTPTITWYDTWTDFSYKTWTIDIKNVSFAYDTTLKEVEYDQSSVFSNFSVTIPWWKKTALVWSSGSWKSTLVKLIAWYLRPDSGTLLVDWQDLSTVSLKSYYQHIGYLTQEPSVFDGTIRENLEYGMHENTDEATIETVIRLSKCEWVYDLPQWLDTEIGEKWVRLSWWQRQRLAIAKIMLKDPRIIILDEPTSALDSFAEEAISEAMHNLFAGRTVIIIAHRLQTVKNADDIIVIESGEIIERGTHTELVNQWWSYAKMLELQAGF